MTNEGMKYSYVRFKEKVQNRVYIPAHLSTTNSYLTNYGQKANLWTFWTFSYGGKFRNLGGNRGVRALWTRILPRGMRNIERM
jgi:hypothetical protein